MRAHSDQLLSVLAASNSRRLVVDVLHGSDRALEGLELTGWELKFDLTAEIKMSGSATAVYESSAGESLVPVGTEGVLSPFRATLLMVMEVSVGDFSERVTLGFARVTAITSAFDTFADSPAGPVVVGSQVEFEFKSFDENLARRGFRSPEQPPALDSCFTELRRITGMPVTESVTDVPIPTSIVYETTQGGRLKGAQDLAGVLGGVGVIDSSGAWTVVPSEPGGPVGELVVGADGTVLDVGYSVDTDTIYNCVVGNFEADDDARTPIYSVAEELNGDLATTGFYGENTRYYSSEFVKNQTAADSAVQAILSQSIGGQTYKVPIQCMFNPLIEMGDVLTATGWVRPLQGRVLDCSLSDAALMNVTLEVQRAL